MGPKGGGYGGNEGAGRTEQGAKGNMEGECRGCTQLAGAPPTKKTHAVRVYLQNIGGLLTSVDDKVKYTHMQQFITMNKIDVIALPECSTNWGEMTYKQ